MNVVDEILFGEVKLPKIKNSSLLFNKDLIKFTNFQASFLDKLIKKYGNRIGLVSFRIWVCDKCLDLINFQLSYILLITFGYIIGMHIYIYDMDLNYDGIYKISLISNIIALTNQVQFVSLILVLEAFYNIKVNL